MDGPGNLSDYDFELPEHLIAQEPVAERTGSRLLVLDRATGERTHTRFARIGRWLRDGDLLVVNDTRVLAARAWGRRDRTDGRVEILFLQEEGPHLWEVLLKTRGAMQSGELMSFFDGALRLELVARRERGAALVRVLGDPDVRTLLDAHGTMPLPPYIRREREGDERSALDRERYQTVYAKDAGAVAAPTAGLHFTDTMLGDLRDRGIGIARVTLHVGLGTFQPIEVEEVEKHRMHAEWYRVPHATADAVNATRARGGRVVAVGTTSLRSLESAWSDQGGAVEPRVDQTRLFIHPPHVVRSIDAMITNFHLPKSSLMLLVSALAGRDLILETYAEAVAEGYRFFSYGDAMLIL